MRIINTYREPVDPEKKLTEEEIISQCCKNVPVDGCSEVGRVGEYSGADQKYWDFDVDEALAKARADNPKSRIIGVQAEGIGPPPGTPCGKLYESWQDRNNCCDGVEPLAWDMDITPDVLPHDRSIIIAWIGGTGGEVTVTTSSNGTWFSDGRKSATGHGSSIELFAGETFCGATSVSVRDGCSTATIMIRSDTGRWVEKGPGCVAAGSAVDWTNPYQNVLYGTVVSGRDKIFETVESAYKVIGLDRIPQCMDPYIPYTQHCANCFGEAYCPDSLAYVNSQPQPCLSYERRQGTIWLSWTTEDGITAGQPLMKHCSDQATLLFSGSSEFNLCYNRQARVHYIRPVSSMTYRWEC